MKSHLLEGIVRHRRALPFTYALEHGVYYAAIDLDELDAIARHVRLIRRNRRGVLELRDGDHLDPPASDLRAAFHAHLRSQDVDAEGWRITLVTSLRTFGHVFNPASFYLCRDEEGSLRVVVVEVHNTYGERHLYTLRPQSDGSAFRAAMAKDFDVSPFIEIRGGYRVLVRDDPTRLRITINHEHPEGLILHASLDLVRRPLTDRILLRLLIRHPLVTLKTIGMIHWHALRLWLRGARFHRHGEATR
jgi:DUF1365 family protein